MNLKRLTPTSSFALGALNGLLVGLAFEKARVAYLDSQLAQAARDYAESSITADFVSVRWEPATPLMSMLVLALAGYFVRHYFMHRPHLLFSLWIGLGSVAVILGYFMSTRTPDLFSYLWLVCLVVVAYLVHRSWRSHPNSLPLLWPVNGISAFIVVALAVQLIGLFFYWPELRSPRVWLLCLVGVVAINMIFGTIVQFFFSRVDGGENEHKVSFSG